MTCGQDIVDHRDTGACQLLIHPESTTYIGAPLRGCLGVLWRGVTDSAEQPGHDWDAICSAQIASDFQRLIEATLANAAWVERHWQQEMRPAIADSIR